MARRRKASSVGSLDSLLDTMSNVVGILVFVLIITQMNVGEAMQNITERVKDLPPVTVEDYEQLEKDAEQLAADLRNARAAKATLTIPSDAEKLRADEMKARIEQLRKDLQELQLMGVKLEDAQRNAENAIKEKDKLAEEAQTAQKRLEELRAMLDKTPKREVLPAHEIRLPNPRSAPKKRNGQPAQRVPFIVRDGRVAMVPIDQIREKLKAILKRMPQKPETKETYAGIDPERFNKYFSKPRIRVPQLDIEVVSGGRHAYVRVTIAEGGGDTLQDFQEKPTATMTARCLNHVKSKQDYAFFHVASNSFLEYSLARTLADQGGVLAGWEPRQNNYIYATHIQGNVLATQKPKPKPAGSKPAPKPKSDGPKRAIPKASDID